MDHFEASLQRDIANVAAPPSVGDLIANSAGDEPRPRATEGDGPPRGKSLRRSLAACALEGVAAEVTNACSGAAMVTAWAIYLHASPLLIGALWGLPYFGQLLQLPAAWLTSHYGRRRIAILGHGLSRLMALPLAFLPFVPAGAPAKRAIFVGLVAVAALLAVVGHNAWVTWMSDLVPARIRGRYFARRAILCTLGGTAASLSAGVVMDAAHRSGTTGITLAALSVLAAASGGVAAVFMVRQHDPPGTHPERLLLREVTTPFTHRASRRLIAFHVAWHSSIGITASLCAITMLEALRIGFAGMAIYNAGVACVRLLATRLWGRALDRVGARPILAVCSFGLALSSALWLLAGEGRIWPIALDAALSGALLSGHELAAFAAPLRVAPRVARPLHLAAFAMASGLSFGIASVAGGTMTELLPSLSVALDARTLFAASCCGRFAAGILALRILEPGAQPVAGLSRLLRGARRQQLAAPSR